MLAQLCIKREMGGVGHRNEGTVLGRGSWEEKDFLLFFKGGRGGGLFFQRSEDFETLGQPLTQ